LPALGSVALSPDTGEINLGGGIFSGRCDLGRSRTIETVGAEAWRPHRARTPWEWWADRMPVTTREASALNSTPLSAVSPAAGVWSSSRWLPVWAPDSWKTRPHPHLDRCPGAKMSSVMMPFPRQPGRCQRTAPAPAFRRRVPRQICRACRATSPPP